MKILITGGAGFIGSHLSEYLLEQGHEVTIIDNLITGQKTNIEKLLSNTNFKYIESDIVKMDFSELPAFDRIYHLASPASQKIINFINSLTFSYYPTNLYSLRK
jgi:UDP-glucuronate decarboxylase